MPSKVTMIFHQQTGDPEAVGFVRTAGWTESVWVNTNDHTLIRQLIELPGGMAPNSIIHQRRRILSTTGTIRGYRIQSYNLIGQQLLPTGGMTPRSYGGAGQAGDADSPGLALLIRMNHDTIPASVRLRTAGIPDGWVVGGEVGPAADLLAIGGYIGALARSFGSILIDPLQAPVVIRSITGNGVITGVLPISGLAVNTIVKVAGSLDACRRRRGGVYVITEIGNPAGTIKINGWQWGPTTGGKVRRHVRGFYQFSATGSDWLKNIVRKVGAPFDQFRGRRSSRRRVGA